MDASMQINGLHYILHLHQHQTCSPKLQALVEGELADPDAI